VNITLEKATKMARDLKKDGMSREDALSIVKPHAKPEVVQQAIELTYDGLKPVSTVAGQATETEPEDLFPEIPDVFKSYSNWLTFESAEKKAPIISGTFSHAKSNDPTTWVNYPTLLQNIREGKGYRNIGFSPDGERTGYLTAVDIDNSVIVQTGEIAPWALRLLKSLGATYAEVTVSGSGLRAWVVIKRELHTSFELGETAKANPTKKAAQIEVVNDKQYMTFSRAVLATSVKAVRELTDKETEAFFQFLGELQREFSAASIVPNSEGKEKSEIPRDANNLVPHGELHRFLLHHAGIFRNAGLEPNEIEIALLRVAHSQCAPPIDESKVRQIARSMGNYEIGKALYLNQESSNIVVAGDAVPMETFPEVASISEFDDSAITGIYRKIVDAACNGTTIPRQYAFLAAKVYIGAMVAGKIRFEGMEDTSSYYGVPIGATGTGKGLAWKRVVKDILALGSSGSSSFAPVKILYGSGDSGAGLLDYFFDSPKDAPVICMIDEIAELGHKAGDKKQPEIIDALVRLATSHEFDRVKAARSAKAKAGRHHDNAHLSIYMCGQNREVIAAAFPNKRGVGIYERFYPEFSAPVIAGRLPKVDPTLAAEIWGEVQKLPKVGEIKQGSGIEDKIEEYWQSLPAETQTFVRLKAHLTRDMFMAAHGRGSMIVEMQDLEAALKNFPRFVKIRESFFNLEVPDKVGMYTARLKDITAGMRRRLNKGEPVWQVALSLRDLQTATNAFRDNDLTVFSSAWRAFAAHVRAVRVERRNGRQYDKFIPEPYEDEEDNWRWDFKHGQGGETSLAITNPPAVKIS
jgi:hypothetical protein